MTDGTTGPTNGPGGGAIELPGGPPAGGAAGGAALVPGGAANLQGAALQGQNPPQAPQGMWQHTTRDSYQLHKDQ